MKYIIVVFYDLSLYIHDKYDKYAQNIDSIYVYFYDIVLNKILKRMLNLDSNIKV